MNLFRGIPVFLLLLLAACKHEPEREPAIGEAFAGPTSLSVRQDITLQSPVSGTASHGERLEILQRRRRFVRVRTPRGAEGWTDERLLLSPEEISGLRRLSDESKSAYSQGLATSYETLNIHTAPDRQSPSFLQVKEGEKVDVIGRRVTPRVAPTPAKLPRPAPKPRPAKRSKESKKSKQVAPPPPPEPPAPPKNWVELSKLFGPPELPAPQEVKPIPLDDWSLIRNAGGESGWVLTRRLVMAIPDEVAQYAEGRRITSYFALGETHDGELVKKSWLWTTVEHGLTPYDFDGFRVFVWSLRRHRYETAHIERNLIGYFPVRTQSVAAPKARARDAEATGDKVPGFSLVIEKNGSRYRRYYSFVGNAVRFSGEEALDSRPSLAMQEPSRAGPANEARQAASPAPAHDSFFSRVRDQLAAWRKRLFGR